MFFFFVQPANKPTVSASSSSSPSSSSSSLFPSSPSSTFHGYARTFLPKTPSPLHELEGIQKVKKTKMGGVEGTGMLTHSLLLVPEPSSPSSAAAPAAA